MAGPKERDAPLHPVEVRLDGVLLGRIELGRQYATYELFIPPELAERAEKRYAILTLESPTWRPANDLPGATDVRDLGVRVDWIEVR